MVLKIIAAQRRRGIWQFAHGKNERGLTMIPFDTTDKALRQEITRNVIKSIHKQAAELKPGGPYQEPPSLPPVNPNPKRHDIVAWRHDGGIEHRRFETKEAAQEYGACLSWVVFYKWALMYGRDMVEKHDIAVPADWGLRDDGLPFKL